MKLSYALAVAAAFVVAAPALAADKDKDQGQDAPKEKKICHTETVTGSLIAKQRICKTQAEWDEIAAATSKSLDDINRSQNRGADSGSANGANNTAGLGGF